MVHYWGVYRDVITRVGVSPSPIMYGHDTGSEAMYPIAEPMLGGMSTTLFLTILMLPAAYLIWQRVLLREGLDAV